MIQKNTHTLLIYLIWCHKKRIKNITFSRVDLKWDQNFSTWWFQMFFIFTPTWGNDPIWRIFFKRVETTNQIQVVVSIFFHVHPFLGKISNLTYCFQMGRNHKQVMEILHQNLRHVWLTVYKSSNDNTSQYYSWCVRVFVSNLLNDFCESFVWLIDLYKLDHSLRFHVYVI